MAISYGGIIGDIWLLCSLFTLVAFKDLYLFSMFFIAETLHRGQLTKKHHNFYVNIIMVTSHDNG